MALKPCPECTKDVSEKATKCPHCGARLRKAKRGFLGLLMKWLFIGFQLIMVWWIIAGLGSVGESMEGMNEAERAGATAGAGIAITMIMTIWAIGTVIFGALAHFSRGRD